MGIDAVQNKKRHLNTKFSWTRSRLRKLLSCEYKLLSTEKAGSEGRVRTPEGRAKSHKESFSVGQVWALSREWATYAVLISRITMDHWWIYTILNRNVYFSYPMLSHRSRQIVLGQTIAYLFHRVSDAEESYPRNWTWGASSTHGHDSNN